ncbi:hypothetical protein EJF36_08670 [Bacillus sp. HMF5848]|uniref:hypothetical protein n=1 Tax=Bacillus sp. HMF5848 TaxID=2495421 RepID=UPI000F78EDB9|nr:hypothetical protein [Bacillus sp. HMF5848]RSK26938.1 hypothetical protein EJF36_08670 [Bacillus sp. HMF5848]
MRFSFADVQQVARQCCGVYNDDVTIEAYMFSPDKQISKSLYITVSKDEIPLNKAIENGAIAAVLPIGAKVPKYTPTHFPVFFINNVLQGVYVLLDTYVNRFDKEGDKKTKPMCVDGVNDWLQTQHISEEELIKWHKLLAKWQEVDK